MVGYAILYPTTTVQMTNTPREIPVQKQLETPSEESTILDQFSSSLDQMIQSYSTPEKISDARKALFKSQFTRLREQFESYKTTPHGQKLVSEAEGELIDSPIIVINNLFLDIQSFLNGTDEQKIFLGIERTSHRLDSKVLWSLLPDGYTNAEGNISKEVMDDMEIRNNASKFENKMKLFLSGKSTTVPHFNIHSFEDHPQLITEFLQRPGSILGIYEDRRTERLAQKSPEFTKILNDVLVKEYPDFFGKIQYTKWYTGKSADFKRISTLLDIIKYDPHVTEDFIEMMNLAEQGKSDEAYDKYNSHFNETSIGANIRLYFQDSKLFSSIREHTEKVLDRHLPKGDIYELVQNGNQAKEVSKDFFVHIPQDKLEKLLTLLPIIEAQCPNGDMDALIQTIDSQNNDIDPVYKQRFFAGLFNISATSNRADKQAVINFYVQ